jgi:hypothetical protein
MKTMQEELSDAYKTSSQLWKAYLLQLFALRESVEKVEGFVFILSVLYVYNGQKIDYASIAIAFIIPRVSLFLHAVIWLPAVEGFKNSWNKSRAKRKNRA